jgi:hypothetical protein
MDMLAPVPPPRTKKTLLPRWLRVSGFVALILLVQGTLAYLLTWIDPAAAPTFVSLRGSTRADIRKSLDELAQRRSTEPVIVYLNGIALPGADGRVLIVPADGSPGHEAGWLPLREVLEKLQACRSRHKLLVFDWLPPPALDRVGYVYHDVAELLPAELAAVPDADRLVLSACAPGQQPLHSDELGGAVFAHYFEQALLGHADGYGAPRDTRITTAELTAFLQARVERWAIHNRGQRQTPTLLGTGSEFTVARVAQGAPRSRTAPEVDDKDRFSPRLWEDCEALVASGDFRLNPRAFQKMVAGLQMIDQQPWRHVRGAREPAPIFGAKVMFPAEAGRSAHQALEEEKKALDRYRWALDQQLAAARPADAERIRRRFIEELRVKKATDAEAVFANVLADARLEPGTLRLFDRLLHPTPTTTPANVKGLCILQLADLAMRIEVQAWPYDLVELALRCTDAGEKAVRQTPHLPGYDALLAEPAAVRHAGEIRLWARGYADADHAKRLLQSAHAQFDQLVKLNERWDRCTLALDEAMAKLPWYLEALDALPELREPWQQTAQSVRALAGALKQKDDDASPWAARVVRLADQVAAAEKEKDRLQQRRRELHAAFATDSVARLERQCRAPGADAQFRQIAAALMSVPAPVIKAQDRSRLRHAVAVLSHRLNEETLALDRQDDDAQRPTPGAATKAIPVEAEARRAELRAGWQHTLLELAGVSADRLQPLRQAAERGRWSEVGSLLHDLTHRQMIEQWRQETDWRARERLAWVMPTTLLADDLDRTAPTVARLHDEKARRDRWLQEHYRYLARDYQGLNLECPGVVAARSFYAARVDATAEAHVRFKVSPAEPLTERNPYTNLMLEVIRQVPPGAFGPVDLRVHRPDDVWLEMAPDEATLPALAAATEPRTLVNQVPLKAMRLAKAERTGLPPPLGFLIEARFEGRSYHHLAVAPIRPRDQELQILVSTDPEEPTDSLSEIRVRPGKVRQPHYVYVKNLTNRPQKAFVEIKSGTAILSKGAKLLTIEPDGVRKVTFDDGASRTELRGAISIRVLDAERQKVLAERSLRVEIMAPQEYVRVAEASYEPGGEGNNRWTVQVLPARPVAGPAIAAQLVLPVQRIPGLLGIGGGTLQVDVPTRTATPRTLFAERLRLINVADEEGPVYLHIDGVARAFVYRTTFTRGGAPTQPKPDDRPAVRLAAPPCVMAGVNCLIDVEVDNAPRGTRLEVALGRLGDDNSFKPDVVREYTDAKKYRIDLEPARDALVFDASIADWTATFDTRALVGARELRARLIDPAGKEISQARHSLVIDDTPPIARILTTPPQVKKGSVLAVQAQGVDPESGVAQVVFFLGKPDKGEVPPDAPRYKAVPANREGTQWAANLDVPANHKGPLAIGVQVVNHAGMATIDTAAVEVIDHEPGKTGRGEIRGKVFEGARPQANLLVSLIDERGNTIARTTTGIDGAYVFEQVAPGSYRVQCIKPESQRRATLNVTVEPDRMSKADLALSL